MPRNDLRTLARNTAGTLSRQLGGGLLQLVTTILIGRLMGPEGNGAFAIALLVPTALSTFLTLGIPTANVYLVGSGRHSLLTACIGNLRVWLGLVLGGLAFGAYLIAVHGQRVFPTVDASVLWIALGSYPSMLLMNLALSLLQAQERFRQYNLAFISLPTTQLGLSAVYLLLYGGRSLEHLAWIQLAAATLGAFVACAFLISHVRPLRNTRTGYVAPAVRYGVKAHLSNILSYVNHKIDIFLVNFFLGAQSAGIYVVASQISERLWLLSQGLSTALLPRLSSMSDEEARRVLTPLLTRWILALTAAAGLLLALVAPVVIRLLFGDDFASADRVIQILVPGIAVGAASRVIASDFSARGRPELSMYTSWIAVIVNTAGNIVLIPILGVDGAAISTSFAYILNLALRCLMYKWLTGVRIGSCLLLSRSDVRTLWQYLARRRSQR